eukprot:gnl/TRDRNA2_/TRDRNA2_145657_c3_seq1.p1 gnl/TRDRNA2_/TRDRNA2_145657_c3~~gnl/TRDRNA2_/TRDRNA2_145657_c3_seq1.p1  ORF type:complete len:222 (+),score=22.15 gnl/TRDRNA2_/TRDRNA2_145657_c3_seq1:94-666(+)
MVQRGQIAMAPGKFARRIVNAEAVKSFVRSTYPTSTVILAQVSMEDFTLAEEIALAGLTDVLIAAYGSAMWWGVFMPEGSCLLWLYPKMHFGYPSREILPPVVLPTWGRDSHLEYGRLRRLWHIKLHGIVPPGDSNYSGLFELTEDHEKQDYAAFANLDIYVNMGMFKVAFDGILHYFASRPWLSNSSRF